MYHLRPTDQIHEHHQRDEDGTTKGEIYFIREDDGDIGYRALTQEELDHADAIIELDEDNMIKKYIRVHDPGIKTYLNPDPTRAAETSTGPYTVPSLKKQRRSTCNATRRQLSHTPKEKRHIYVTSKPRSKSKPTPTSCTPCTSTMTNKRSNGRNVRYCRQAIKRPSARNGWRTW